METQPLNQLPTTKSLGCRWLGTNFSNLWVKRRYTKWNPGKRKQGRTPAAHILVGTNFDCILITHRSDAQWPGEEKGILLLVGRV